MSSRPRPPRWPGDKRAWRSSARSSKSSPPRSRRRGPPAGDLTASTPEEGLSRPGAVMPARDPPDVIRTASRALSDSQGAENNARRPPRVVAEEWGCDRNEASESDRGARRVAVRAGRGGAVIEVAGRVQQVAGNQVVRVFAELVRGQYPDHVLDGPRAQEQQQDAARDFQHPVQALEHQANLEG